MDDDELRFLDFIYAIPLDANPYNAAIEYLNSATTPPSLPQWARHLLQFFIACYVLMWFQSFYLLYVRFETRMFRLITVTRLGLWRVDVPNMSGLAYFLYPPLVIADLTLQGKIDEGKRDLTDKVPLLACKFLLVLIASWAFLWVCACQCLSNYWDDQCPEALRHGRRVQLPRYVVITMNILFVCLLTWFVPCIIYLTARSNEEYKMIRQILSEVVTLLTNYIPQYDPDTYRPSTLITVLLPSKAMLLHEQNMAHYLRKALLIGLSDLIFLCLLYAPLLRYSIGAIQRRTEECTFAVTTFDNDQSEKLAHIKHRVRQEYWTSFIHGLAVYLTALALLPVLIWQVCFPGSSFLRSQKWLVVTQVGMHGPFAISGNIIVLLLNLQAQRLLDVYRIQQNASRANFRTRGSPLHQEFSSTNSDDVSENVHPGPPSLGDKTMELEATK